MKRQFIHDENGQQISFDDWEYKNKYFDKSQYKWDDGESNVKGKGLHANYYQLVPQGLERKGVIHYVHGYGDPIRNYAFLGHMFANQGFEFWGFD